MKPAVKTSVPYAGPAKMMFSAGIGPVHLDDGGLDVGLQQRLENEEAPDAVDDRGDAGEQLDGDADRLAQPRRAKLRLRKMAMPSPTGMAIIERDRGGDQRAVDCGPCAVDVVDRVPVGVDEEVEAERLEGGQRAPDQRADDAAEQQQHQQRRAEREDVEDVVAGLEARERVRAREHVAAGGCGTAGGEIDQERLRGRPGSGRLAGRSPPPAGSRAADQNCSGLPSPLISSAHSFFTSSTTVLGIGM